MIIIYVINISHTNMPRFTTHNYCTQHRSIHAKNTRNGNQPPSMSPALRTYL